MDWKFLTRVVLKALGLFVALNVLLALVEIPFGRLSGYNALFPGRPRFPFGENTEQSNNLSLYDLDAMFAAHTVAGRAAPGEFRVFLMGDSSVWGTLLRPEETLAGQLNAAGLEVCGQPARFYNLGYPTVSLAKDVLLLDRAAAYDPDLVVWLTTLEAFVRERQFDSPLAANNAAAMRDLIARYELNLDPRDPALKDPNFWQRTLVGRRRALADLARLQLLGPRWAAAGIDQFYPAEYEPAQRDFDADTAYYGLTGPDLPAGFLSADLLSAGMRAAGAPVLLVNEPMLRASGENSSLWYNFFYPRWAYDAYRGWLAAEAQANDWRYLDAWDIAPEGEFTNSAIHLTPAGEALLAEQVAREMSAYECP